MADRTRVAMVVILLALGVTAAPAGAQVEPVPEPELQGEVARAVADLYNDPRRIRYNGDTTIPHDSTVRGDVAVLAGRLTVEGEVRGSVLVINGDLLLGDSASVTGDVLVVGGAVSGLDAAWVGGEVLIYRGMLRYRLEGERLVLRPASEAAYPSAGPRPGNPEPSARAGELDFLITTGNSYNRVEGLPITFGPRLRTGGTNPLYVHALAIYRTESGFTSDIEELGYYVRAQQYIGENRRWSVGGTLHLLTDPIEDWHLSDLENGLSTFLFHQDFRDHYEREGLSAFTTWQPAGGPLLLTGEVRWELNRSLSPGSPLTLFDNAEPWRAQPVVGAGRIGTFGASATYDTRSDHLDPSSGWYFRGRIEQGFDVELERPPLTRLDPGGAVADVPARAFGRFTAGTVDLRRYNRLSPDVRLNLRGLLGGSLTGAPLPPQRQHAFGGEGSLPGYSLFSQDCGARDLSLRRAGPDGEPASEPVYPHYGCDGFTLVQAEVRGKLDFRLRFDTSPWEGEDDDDRGLGFGWDVAPDWAVFLDAGTGWAFGGRPDEPVRVDAGAGLIVDRLGLFFAAPLSGDGGFNVFVRLGSRF